MILPGPPATPGSDALPTRASELPGETTAAPTLARFILYDVVNADTRLNGYYCT